MLKMNQKKLDQKVKFWPFDQKKKNQFDQILIKFDGAGPYGPPPLPL